MKTTELETINEARLLIEKYEVDELRQCDICDTYMVEGFVCCGSTYCSEPCLTKGSNTRSHYEWESTHYTEDGECYWTEWSELE